MTIARYLAIAGVLFLAACAVKEESRPLDPLDLMPASGTILELLAANQPEVLEAGGSGERAPFLGYRQDDVRRTGFDRVGGSPECRHPRVRHSEGGGLFRRTDVSHPPRSRLSRLLDVVERHARRYHHVHPLHQLESCRSRGLLGCRVLASTFRPFRRRPVPGF